MTSTESRLLDILHGARYPTASSLPWHIEKYDLLEQIMELFQHCDCGRRLGEPTCSVCDNDE